MRRIQEIVTTRASGRLTAIITAAVIAASALTLSVGAAPASAASFDPGNIISDANFFNADSMSQSDVQSFLERMMPNCTAANGVACLRSYHADTFTRSDSRGWCSTYPGGPGEPASQIIWKVGQACGISPRVLLTTLQKEQGLITNRAPTPGQYRSAMGYGCPDSAACSAEFYGFFNQVYKAAWQFRAYGAKPAAWRYHPGAVSVQFNYNKACGSSVVNIQNQATANLYNYTPYQPNAASLAHPYALGDSCSAYGNRNFWLYYNAWFGASTGATLPVGSLDAASVSATGITASGWAIDPETSAPISVHYYLDGAWTGAATADRPRPDLSAAYPSSGPNHGYTVSMAASPGAHQVCVFAINVFGGTSNPLIGCRDIVVASYPPQGALESVVSIGGQVKVSGWALDDDSPSASLPIRVSINGVSAGSARADVARPDIAQRYPAAGSAHGFSASVPLVGSGEVRSVCVFATDAGGVGEGRLGCQNVSTIDQRPIGSLDEVSTTSLVTRVQGWALDPDSTAPSSIELYVDGVWSGNYTADGDRPDIDRVYGAGAAHGFTIMMPVQPVGTRLCVFAVDSDGGVLNRLLACRTTS